MAEPGGVFLSAVTSEFETARTLVAEDLRKKKYDVTFQGDFSLTSGTLLEKLDGYVRTCRAVVCIVGKRSGSLPTPVEAAPFADKLPEGMRDASYTQWEVLLAIHHGKELFIFQAADDYVPDRPEPTGEDDPGLQERFAKWLIDDAARDRLYFSDNRDLQHDVLTSDVVVGARRAGALLDAGVGVDEAKPPASRRKSPDEANRPKRNRDALVGRDDELDDVLHAIDKRYDQLTLLVGPTGIGKRALLQELAHDERLQELANQDEPGSFEDGVGIEPILTDREGIEGLRQAIWEEYFEAPDPSTVTPQQRTRDLKGLKSLVVIPDIDPFVDAISELRDELGDDLWLCASASDEAVEEMKAEQIPIEGLLDAEMLELFEDRYRDPVPDEARADVLALCEQEEGNPARIELLAQKARKEARVGRRQEGSHPLIAWAAERRGAGAGASPAPESTSPEQAKALATVQAVGTEVPRDLLADVSGSATAIDEALEDGRLEEGSPRYRLNPVLDDHPQTEETRRGHDELMVEVFERASSWAETASHSEIYHNRAFVLRMLSWGCQSGHDILARDDKGAVHEAHRRWRDVIAFGRVVEPTMALGGRHGAWEEVLKCVEDCARADLSLSASVQGGPDSGAAREPEKSDERTNTDPAGKPVDSGAADVRGSEALGWALHQRGSRALLRDELDDARTYLNESLQHREDDEGRELTRKNMALLPLGVIPFVALLFVPLFLASVVAAQVVAFDESGATADVTPDALRLDGSDAYRYFTVRNVGDEVVWVRDFGVEEESDDLFGLDPAPQEDLEPCQIDQSLEVGEFCTIAVKSLQDAPASGLLDVLVESRSGRRKGDQSVVMIRVPESD